MFRSIITASSSIREEEQQSTRTLHFQQHLSCERKVLHAHTSCFKCFVFFDPDIVLHFSFFYLHIHLQSCVDFLFSSFYVSFEVHSWGKHCIALLSFGNMVRVSFIFSDIRSTASYLFLISKINHFHLFLVVFDNEKKACLKNGVVFFGISHKVWNVDSKWTSLMPYIARYQSKNVSFASAEIWFTKISSIQSSWNNRCFTPFF